MRPSLPSALAALAAACLASPAVAQEMSWSNGVLGSQIDYHMQADPGEIWILGLSASEGPTPLSLVDPLDPRLIFVGIDLIQFWPVGVVPPSGDFVTSFLLPPDPNVVGFKIHSQFLTISGLTSTLVDDISNTVVFRLQLPGTSVPTVGKRPLAGIEHEQTLLANGRVLLTGGLDPTGGETLDLNESYWPQGQVFVQSLGAPLTARTGHSATLLSDGRVLVAGGRDDNFALDDCALIDPVADTVSATGALPEPRSRHTATLLDDGRVLVVGGLAVEDSTDEVATLLSALPETAIYDPVFDRWSVGPTLPVGVFAHTATRLDDGRVLVCGGIEVQSLFGFPSQTWTDRAWLIDVNAGTVEAAAPLPVAVAHHAAIRPEGDPRPVVIGGERIDLFFLPVNVADVHRYDPATDAWSVMAPLTHARAHHAITEAAGRIVVVGGVSSLDSMTLIETPEPTAEVALSDLSAWESPIPLLLPRPRVRATAYDDGLRVIVTGGEDGSLADPTAEILMP